MPKVNIPWLSVALGVAAGIIGGLNVASFGLAQPWSELVTFACAAIAAVGISPLTHAALRVALHLSYPAALAIAGVITTVTAAVTATNWDVTLKGIVVGVLTAAAGVLAGPEAPPAPPTPSPTPSPKLKAALAPLVSPKSPKPRKKS